MLKKILPVLLLTVFMLSACGRDVVPTQTRLPDLPSDISAVPDTQGTEIVITVGDIVVTAELDDSETAQQFVALLPQTISMTRGRERVYYGGISGDFLDYDEENIKVDAENGDLAYWFSGNSLSLFFNVTKGNSDVNSGIVVFGKITSDLSVFDDMDGNETVLVTLFNETERVFNEN